MPLHAGFLQSRPGVGLEGRIEVAFGFELQAFQKLGLGAGPVLQGQQGVSQGLVAEGDGHGVPFAALLGQLEGHLAVFHFLWEIGTGVRGGGLFLSQRDLDVAHQLPARGSVVQQMVKHGAVGTAQGQETHDGVAQAEYGVECQDQPRPLPAGSGQGQEGQQEKRSGHQREQRAAGNHGNLLGEEIVFGHRHGAHVAARIEKTLPLEAELVSVAVIPKRQGADGDEAHPEEDGPGHGAVSEFVERRMPKQEEEGIRAPCPTGIPDGHAVALRVQGEQRQPLKTEDHGDAGNEGLRRGVACGIPGVGGGRYRLERRGLGPRIGRVRLGEQGVEANHADGG